MSAVGWTPADILQLRRSLVIMRNGILDARVQLAVFGPLLSTLMPADVQAMRLHLVDADTALLHVIARLREVAP